MARRIGGPILQPFFKFANQMLRRALLASAPSLRSRVRSPCSPFALHGAVAAQSPLGRPRRAFSVATSEQEILNSQLESEAVPFDSDSTGLWVNNIYRLGPLWYDALPSLPIAAILWCTFTC